MWVTFTTSLVFVFVFVFEGKSHTQGVCWIFVTDLIVYTGKEFREIQKMLTYLLRLLIQGYSLQNCTLEEKGQWHVNLNRSRVRTSEAFTFLRLTVGGSSVLAWDAFLTVVVNDSYQIIFFLFSRNTWTQNLRHSFRFHNETWYHQSRAR